VLILGKGVATTQLRHAAMSSSGGRTMIHPAHIEGVLVVTHPVDAAFRFTVNDGHMSVEADPDADAGVLEAMVRALGPGLLLRLTVVDPMARSHPAASRLSAPALATMGRATGECEQ
jgi:hypothetical protein